MTTKHYHNNILYTHPNSTSETCNTVDWRIRAKIVNHVSSFLISTWYFMMDLIFTLWRMSNVPSGIHNTHNKMVRLIDLWLLLLSRWKPNWVILQKNKNGYECMTVPCGRRLTVETCFEPEWVQTPKRIIKLNLLNERFHLSPYSQSLMFFVVINYKSPKADYSLYICSLALAG